MLSSLGGTLGPLFSAPNLVLPEHPSGGRALAAPMLFLPVLGLAALLFGLALWFKTGTLAEPAGDGADAAVDELTQGLLVANELMDEPSSPQRATSPPTVPLQAEAAATGGRSRGREQNPP